MRAGSRSLTCSSMLWPLLAITTSSESVLALSPALISSAVRLTPNTLWLKPWSDTTMMLVEPARPRADSVSSRRPTSASSARILRRACAEAVLDVIGLGEPVDHHVGLQFRQDVVAQHALRPGDRGVVGCGG